MKILSVCSLLIIATGVVADPTAPAAGWQSSDVPAAEAVSRAAPIRLQLVKQTDDGLVALINGQLVRQGDNLGSYQVIKIEKDQVLVQQDGQQQILHLLKTAIKNYD